MKIVLASGLILLSLAIFGRGRSAYAFQGPRGELEVPRSNPAKPRTAIKRIIIRRARPDRAPRAATPSSVPAREEPPARCESELLLRCGLPGCEVAVNGTPQGSTDEDGDVILTAPRGQYNVTVSKPGFDSERFKISLDCDDERTKEVTLRGRPLALKFRTSQPECEIFINNSPVAAGRSDGQGLFAYQAAPPFLLIEARKTGYIGATERITITPDLVQKEIQLKLKPIPAQLTVTANVSPARVQVDSQEARLATAEPISVSPGPHKVTVDALGYAPATLEVSPGPGEAVRKSVTLARLPVTDLAAQAQANFNQRAYENVLTLSRYILEVDAQHPAAHRLTGMALLERQEYTVARNHLALALAGNEMVNLRIRRHPREVFDLTKGHDLCDAVLVLGKSELEFRGLRAPADDFKVAYGQVQVTGLQLKKNAALYLGTKVTRTPGKRQDFNFFSPDKELTQSGKAYLEMIQSLLRAH